jgi:hypothetical protein
MLKIIVISLVMAVAIINAAFADHGRLHGIPPSEPQCIIVGNKIYCK